MDFNPANLTATHTLHGQGRSIGVAVGNPDKPGKFEPHTRFEFEDGRRLAFSIAGQAHKLISAADIPTTEFDGGRCQWKVDGDRLRWLFHFDARPKSNRYRMQIDGGDGFDFCWQEPFPSPVRFEQDGEPWLHQDWPAGGPLISSDRPESIDGGYVVMLKRHLADGPDFRLNIHRPRARDAAGRTAWCTIQIRGDSYEIVIPQEFLDTAQYPVAINDTFGYSDGSTQGNTSANYVLAFGPYTAPANGSATKAGVYSRGTSISFTCGIYADTPGTPAAFLRDTGGGSGTSSPPAWVDLDLDSTLSITSGTKYWVAVDAAATNPLSYATGTAYDTYNKASTYSAGTLPNPFPSSPSKSAGYCYNSRITYAATSTPSSSPSRTPSASVSHSPSRTPSASMSHSPSASPSSSASHSPSASPSRTPSASISSSPSASPSRTPSASVSHSPSASPSASASHSPSASPSRTPSASVSHSPSASPSRTPSASISHSPSVSVSHSPSASPSRTPSVSVSHSPSASPSSSESASPSISASSSPSVSLSRTPSASLSHSPSASPSSSASQSPSASPSRTPSASVSHSPSASPSASTSSSPSGTATPSGSPSSSISHSPSVSVSASPSASPSQSASRTPSASVSHSPSASPSSSASHSPSASPSRTPSASISVSPSASPSRTPSASISSSRSQSPSTSSSETPSASPSASASGSAEPVFTVKMSARQGHGVLGHSQFSGVRRPAGASTAGTGVQT